MASVLESKPRVRMAIDEPERRSRSRPPSVLLLGLAGWLGAVAVGFGIELGYLPLGRWLDHLEQHADEQDPTSLGRQSERNRNQPLERAPNARALATTGNVTLRIAPAPSALPTPATSPGDVTHAAPTTWATRRRVDTDDDSTGDDPFAQDPAVQTPELDEELKPSISAVGPKR
jgi:hypothetical protein